MEVVGTSSIYITENGESRVRVISTREALGQALGQAQAESPVDLKTEGGIGKEQNARQEEELLRDPSLFPVG